MTHNNEWLLVEIARGIQKLVLLSLDRTPASKLLPGTAHAWLEAITADNSFRQDRDVARIRAAFRKLARQRESWPAPKHFLDALPRVETRALSYELREASPAEAEAAIARIRELLDEPVPDHRVPEPAERKGGAPSKAELEEQLRTHYATTQPDRKSQAAGPDA